MEITCPVCLTPLDTSISCVADAVFAEVARTRVLDSSSHDNTVQSTRQLCTVLTEDTAWLSALAEHSAFLVTKIHRCLDDAYRPNGWRVNTVALQRCDVATNTRCRRRHTTASQEEPRTRSHRVPPTTPVVVLDVQFRRV